MNISLSQSFNTLSESDVTDEKQFKREEKIHQLSIS